MLTLHCNVPILKVTSHFPLYDSTSSLKNGIGKGEEMKQQQQF
jgi:hypothetical protein